ncbi:hypothetical protein NGUA15_02699 [Salmonella enterica]|nr:hypothetical protein NGUA15_02699 [Salmonella enterica]
MGFTRAVFGLEKADAKECFHMGFDQHLQIFFNGCSFARQFLYFPATEAEKLDIAHGSLLNFILPGMILHRVESESIKLSLRICYLW